MCERRYDNSAVAELQQIAADCPPYPYGEAPVWWGKGREAAGQAARDAIALSVRVSVRLRELAGIGGDTLAMRPAIRALFPDEAERAEAYRLLDLAARNRRRRPGEENGYNHVDRHVEHSVKVPESQAQEKAEQLRSLPDVKANTVKIHAM